MNAQSSEPTCEHIVRHKATPAFLKYLFQTYGVEETEQILLRMKVYEVENNVKVLFSKDFNVMMEKLNSLISNTSNSEEINRLNDRKAIFVKFETIENQLN